MAPKEKYTGVTPDPGSSGKTTYSCSFKVFLAVLVPAVVAGVTCGILFATGFFDAADEKSKDTGTTKKVDPADPPGPIPDEGGAYVCGTTESLGTHPPGKAGAALSQFGLCYDGELTGRQLRHLDDGIDLLDSICPHLA